MIKDMETLKKSYQLVVEEDGINSVLDAIDSLDERRPRYKMNLIEGNPTWRWIRNLSEMKVRKVRKDLFSIPYEEIREFNEVLKKGYPTMVFIQNFHTKEFWITKILDIITGAAKRCVGIVESHAGMDDRERQRTNVDWRVRNPMWGYWGTWVDGDPLVSSPIYFGKEVCTCIKAFVDDSGWDVYRVGRKYHFREGRDGSRAVYTECIDSDVSEQSHYIFEDGSFEEHFRDRDSTIKMILDDE